MLRTSNCERTVTNGLNEKAMCGGALFNRFVKSFGEEKEHQPRSAIFGVYIAGSPQAAVTSNQRNTVKYYACSAVKTIYLGKRSLVHTKAA